MSLLRSMTIGAILSVVGAGAAQATVIYNISSTEKLVSIQNINVNGTQYDVTFQNGSFNSIYGDASNLTFTTSSSAFAASTVLLGLLVDGAVASDGNPYNFDSNNGMTDGCANTIYCDILTTYRVFTNLNGNEIAASSSARNFYDLSSDFVTGISLATSYDTSPWPWYTYAKWTEVVDVPAPASIALMGLGLIGLGFSRRKKVA